MPSILQKAQAAASPTPWAPREIDMTSAGSGITAATPRPTVAGTVPAPATPAAVSALPGQTDAQTARWGGLPQPTGPGLLARPEAEPETNWWDIPAHLGNISESVNESEPVKWISDHGGERFGNWFTEWGGDSAIGKTLAVVTAPITMPVRAYTKGLELLGDATVFAGNTVSFSFQATTMDNPLYRDGVQLDDFGAMWEFAQTSMSPGQAFGQSLGYPVRTAQVMFGGQDPETATADYTSWAPIFDVGYNPYTMDEQQRKDLSANTVYGLGTGFADLGVQVGLAVAGNKGGSLAGRASGLSTNIKGISDIATLDREIADHLAGIRPTPAGGMVEKLAATGDINELWNNPLVNKNSPKASNIVQMLSRVSDPNDVRLIVMADRGDRASIAALMNDAPDYIFEMSDVAPALQTKLTAALPTPLSESTEAFLQSAFKSSTDRNSFFREARDAFLVSDRDIASGGQWTGTTINNSKMPLGTTGVPFLGRVGDKAAGLQVKAAASGGRIARGEGVFGEMTDADNWSLRTLGKIGQSAPLVKTLQWLGGRKPIGLVSLSSTRPADVYQEMTAYLDSAVWTTGKSTFTVSRGGQAVEFTGDVYRREMQVRLTEAASQGPTALASVVKDIEREVLSSIGHRRGQAQEAVDAVVKGLQDRRDFDLAQIQNRGYYFDADASQVLVDPVYQRQLANSIHLTPLREIDREFAPAWENGVHNVDMAYAFVQRQWRTAVLFKPAYTLKNSVAEPLVASILAHGSIFSPDGLYVSATNVMTNTGHRLASATLAATDRVNGTLGHVPGVKKLVENTYAVRNQRLLAMTRERHDLKTEIETWQTELESMKAGEKSPAWVAAHGAEVEALNTAAANRLKEVSEQIDFDEAFHDLRAGDDALSSTVYREPTYGELGSTHERLAQVLREEPDVASARLTALADEIDAKAQARADKVVQVEDEMLARQREHLAQVASNVGSVQQRVILRYATQLEETIAKRKARLERLKANKGAAQAAVKKPDSSVQRVRDRWPVVVPYEKSPIGLEEASIKAMESHLVETLAQYEKMLDPTYAGSTAQRAYLDSLADAPGASHTVRSPAYVGGEERQAAVLRAQAEKVAALTDDQRAAMATELDAARADLDRIRDALNSPDMDTVAARRAAEDRLAALEENFAGLSTLTASQAIDREKYRTRVLGGVRPVVWEAKEDGTLHKVRGSARRDVGDAWKVNEQRRLQGRSDFLPIDERFVVTQGLFDPNAFGEAYRAEFGAGMTQRQAFDPGQMGSVITSKLQRGGGTKAIDHTDPMYWDELAHITNRQVRQDAVTIKMLQGATAADLRKWLDTPEGQKYASDMGWTAENMREQINDAHRLINQYLPNDPLPEATIKRMRKEGYDLPDDATLHNALAVKDMSRSELQEVLAHRGTSLSPVHSGELVFQTANPLRRMQDRIWHTLATKPEERVGRFPGGQRYFEEHMKRDLEIVTRQNGGTITAGEINALRAGAAAKALRDVERTYYNIRRYSHPVYSMRYMTAFPGALYNSMFRMSRLAVRSPGTAGFLADKFTNGFVQIGVDGDGNKTDDFTKVQALVIDLPDYMKKSFGVKDQLSIGLQSLDFVRPSPSFAWTVTVPVDTLLASRPQAAQWMKDNLDPTTQQMLWPFGDPTSKGSLMVGGVVADTLMPSHIRDFLTVIGKDGDRRYVQTVNQYLQAMAFEWEQGGRQGDPPTLKQAQEAANDHWQMQFAAKFGVFGGISLKTAGSFERQQWQNIEAEHPGDYEGALEEFTQKFGVGSEWFTRSTTARKGGIPPTLDAWNRMEENKDLIADIMTVGNGTDPTVLKALFGDDLGEFDQSIYNAQTHTTIPGTDITIGDAASSAEWLANGQASSSWDEYQAAKAVKDATMLRYGYSSLQTKEAAWLNAAWSAYVNDFGARPENQAWLTEVNTRDFGRAERSLRVIDRITSDRSFMQSQEGNPYFEAMSTYSVEYADAQAAYSAAKDSESRNYIMGKWADFVQREILPLDKGFAKFYDRYLDGQDLKAG